MAQIEALLREKRSRAATQRKIDSRLIYEIKMRRGEPVADGVPRVETDLSYNAEGKVTLDLKAKVSDTLLAQLNTYGAEIVSAFPDHNSIRIQVAVGQIEAIAAAPDVTFIQPKQDAITSRVVPSPQDWPQTGPKNAVVDDRGQGREERATTVRRLVSSALSRGQSGGPLINVGTGVGSQSSEGDVAHRANSARGAFNVNGTGVKIGVLSDGVSNLATSQALGDLGPVTVLPGQDGPGDEGTAMLEIIHDLAPGAQLYFATALKGITSFANNIRALRAAGCDIIVDDLYYAVETPFQDGQAPSVVSNTNGGVVTQAVNDVTASGALYFATAGNAGNLDDGSSSVWEGNFVDGGDAGGVLAGAGRVHDFGGQLFDVQTAPGQIQLDLYWSDPLGGSSNDYDLFQLDSTGALVTAASTNTQDGTQDPFEAVPQPAGPSLYVIVKFSGEARFLHLNSNRGAFSIATDGQTHGHSEAANAYSCAATPAGAAFPNPFGPSNVVETFSSDGPRRIFYQADGAPITPGNFLDTGGLLRQKPDITAADGVAVTGVGGFQTPFFGTSAAAPHAAAIAGLVKSANPSLTPAQIRTALTSTAIDIEGPGVDRDSGAGILDAFAAIQSLGVPGFAFVELGAVAAAESSGDGNGQIDPGETGSLAIQLKNSGVLDAAGVTATLTTSTPGVVITQPATSAYPNLPSLGGSGSNAAPFLFSLTGDAPCVLTINFTLTLRYNGGASADPKALNFTVQTGPPPISINSTIDATAPASGPAFTATTGTMFFRHFRDGVVSDCASAKAFPGTTDGGTRQYDAYTFQTCPTSSGGCVTVTLSGDDAINLFTAAYIGNFNPADISQNYLADPGASAVNRSYSFNIPPGRQTFTVVVTDVPSGPPSGAGYKLNISGACVGACSAPPFSVTSTVPSDGSVITAPPTSFTVNISEPADPASLQASDLTVNGIPASSFTYTPGGSTIVFTYGASPVTAQGLQTMSIARGAFTSASNGRQVAVFPASFRYDTKTLAVVSTTPAVGGVFTLPATSFTYDVTFNEPIDPASVQPGDLQLTGIFGAAVTAASVLPGNKQVRFTIAAATEVALAEGAFFIEGPLIVSIPAGVITDQFGNSGTAFTGSYFTDIGTAPYPTPLLAKKPAGSLIYDPSIFANIGFANDRDNFTISLNPDQTVTAIVTGSGGLIPSVKLVKSPSNTTIGSATATAADQPALLQTVFTGDDVSDDASPDFHASKTFTLVVSGANGTTGDYTLRLILNAAQELEGTIAGETNDTPATAQNIDRSFISLGTPLVKAKRGAVTGVTDPKSYTAATVAPTFEDISTTGAVITGLTGVDEASVLIPIGFTFPLYGVPNTNVFVSSNGLLTFGTSNTSFPNFANTDLTDTPPQAAIAPFWDDLHTAGGAPDSNVFFQVSGTGPDQHLTIQWNKIRFRIGGTAGDTITFQAQLFADGRIQFNYLDLTSGAAGEDNGASATVGLKAAGAQGPDRLLLAFNNGPNSFVGTGLSTLISPPNPPMDLFSFNLTEGESNTLVVKSLSGAPASVALLDSSGAVITTGVGGSRNVDSSISNFVAPTSGVYYAKVTSSTTVPYDLVITRNATFDLEGNDTVANAQPLDLSRGVLGGVFRDGAYQSAAITAEFEDISATGAVITGLTSAEDASVSIPIGFMFPFYGVSNTDVFVSSNGLLSFGSAQTEITNSDLTTSPTSPAIAVFWDDLNTDGGALDSNVFFQVSGEGSNKHLTIQWNKVRFFSGGTAGDTITFQAQLFADGRIKLNYLDLASGAASGNNGASATVGVKAAGAQGPDRLLLAFNSGPNDFVGAGKSVQISQPSPEDWYTITVLGGPVRLETTTPGDGRGAFVNKLDPHIELYDSSGTTLLATGKPTDDGRNESINYPGVEGPATYLARVTSEGDSSGEYFLGSGAPPHSLGFSPPFGPISAGSTVPVSFSFGDNLGFGVLASGSPASRTVNCFNGASVGEWEPTSSVNGLQFNPGANAYLYPWVTNSSWANSCRELDVTTQDGRSFKTKIKF